MMKLRIGASARRQRGQSLVEFALVLPIMAVMLSAVLEFGLAMDSDMALEAASREGARIGASLGNDGTQGVTTGAKCALSEATVDPAIINAVQDSLTGAGFDATAMSTVNIWIWGTDKDGGSVSAINKYDWESGAFVNTNGHPYSACGRHDGTFGGGLYDDIVVQVQFTYTSRTGLLAIFTGGLPMTAKSSMPIGPPWKLL